MGKISEDGLTNFTFDGIRRITGAHPETLSRMLTRLEEEGMIEKSEDGYVMTEEARHAFGVHPLGMASPRVPLLHTMLPYDVSVRSIASQLKGRWFGSLRWVGYSDGEESTTMKWVTDDGGIQIDARFSGAVLDIEAKVRAGRNVNDAVRASHQLLSHISRLYSPAHGQRRILQMQTMGRDLMPAAM